MEESENQLDTSHKNEFEEQASPENARSYNGSQSTNPLDEDQLVDTMYQNYFEKKK